MAKILTGVALAAACYVGAGPAAAQPHRGAIGGGAPHISAPAPHVSAAPHISPAPRLNAAPHVSAAPRFNAAPRIHAAPHVATPRFSTRGPSVHQFTPRGHAERARSFAGRSVHGATGTRHAVRGATGRAESRNLAGRNAGRNLTRHATRATGNLARSRERERGLARTHERPLARTNVPTGAGGPATNNRNRVTEPNTRNRVAGPQERNRFGETAGRNRLTGAQVAALSRPLGERNRNDNDRHRFFDERRRFHRGGFIGWFGPVFWPYAYDDFFDYAFWPAEYDDHGFWAYAYDDVFDNVFFTPGTEDIYANVGEGYAVRGGRGRNAERRHARTAARGATGAGAGEICRVDPSLTKWPVDEIAEVVEPTADQQHLLDDLKAASEQAAKILQAACPTTAPSTPVGRLDAMAKRLDAMMQALDTVRPALAKFFDSLSDEQKARFNAMGRQQTAGGGGQPEDEAQLCRTQAPAGLTDQAMRRVEQEVRPNDRQKGDLDAFRDAAAKAADTLRNACPSQTPITPVARLDAMANHVKAMLDAINTVRPALDRFYASLSDEQKAHFNVMARQASNQ